MGHTYNPPSPVRALSHTHTHSDTRRRVLHMYVGVAVCDEQMVTRRIDNTLYSLYRSPDNMLVRILVESADAVQ